MRRCPKSHIFCIIWGLQTSACVAAFPGGTWKHACWVIQVRVVELRRRSRTHRQVSLLLCGTGNTGNSSYTLKQQGQQSWRRDKGKVNTSERVKLWASELTCKHVALFSSRCWGVCWTRVFADLWASCSLPAAPRICARLHGLPLLSWQRSSLFLLKTHAWTLFVSQQKHREIRVGGGGRGLGAQGGRSYQARLHGADVSQANQPAVVWIKIHKTLSFMWKSSSLKLD